jgi:hypothetical protein
MSPGMSTHGFSFSSTATWFPNSPPPPTLKAHGKQEKLGIFSSGRRELFSFFLVRKSCRDGNQA